MRIEMTVHARRLRRLLSSLVLGLSSTLAILSLGEFVMVEAAASQDLHPGPVAAHFPDPATSALVAAALAGNDADLAAAIAGGGDVDRAGSVVGNRTRRFRPLHYVLESGNDAAVRRLLAAGADPTLATDLTKSPIEAAAADGRCVALDAMVQARGIDRLPKRLSASALFEATQHGHTECLGVLIARGVSPDLADRAGFTPLMAAFMQADHATAEWLLEHGASVDPVAPSGVTAPYLLEESLRKTVENSPTWKRLLHIRDLMVAKGAHFPAKSPAELRRR